VPHAETSLAQLEEAPVLAAPPPAAAPMPSAPGGALGGGAGWAGKPAAKKVGGARRSVAASEGALADDFNAPAEETSLAAPAYSRQTRNLAALAAIAVQSGTTRYDLPAAVTVPDKS